MGDAFSKQPGRLASVIADTLRFLKTQVPGLVHEKTRVFHSVEDFLASDPTRRRPPSKEDLDNIHRAEGFFDLDTGDTVIIADNVELRAGETPQDALIRVILHERVGHEGLHTLLGGKDGAAARRWASLQEHIPSTELEAIASQEGYNHLRGNTEALAQEWFARQAENSPHLLQKPGLLRDMWETLKEQFRRLGNFAKGTPEPELDRQLRDLLRQSRKAALKAPGQARMRDDRGADAGAAQGQGQVHTRQFSLASYAALRKREDKPQSWQEVKPGHRWMPAKQHLPRTGDKVPVFPILKRGTFQEQVNAVANWLTAADPVSDPWGMKVIFNHPQDKGTQPTAMHNRAAHLIGENLDKNVENRSQDKRKIAWFGAVRKTIQDAQARAVAQTGEVLYFRSYQDGIHMVVVDDGEVRDQGAIITQYAPESFEGRYKDVRVEFARDTNHP